jgi:hypothetical protein
MWRYRRCRRRACSASSMCRAMAIRMAEYCLWVYRLFGRFPRQILLYVGDAPLRMETTLRGPSTSRCAGLALGTRPSMFAISMATAYWKAAISAII